MSAEFRNLRLPLGTGLLGLVAQTGAPYYTDDYQSDSRFLHRDYIDHARLFEETQAALAEVDAANQQIRAHSEAVEVVPSAHDRLTDVLLHGGGVRREIIVRPAAELVGESAR